MNLSQDIKRILNALAYANAGENLNPIQKRRALAGCTVPVPAQTLPATRTSGPQVGLYLGHELPVEIMQYVVHTCTRLKHGLTVMTFETETDAQALLAPHRELLAAAGIEARVIVMTGEPPAGLAHALRKHPEVAFLVCNESGYFGHGLLSGAQRKDSLPVPVVLVAGNDASTLQQPAAAVTARRQAA